ncbi:hypothetical protein AVEN_235934-1 [Araneus ventricosus]|uniref:DNA-directed DNA polymerase n=1 Tax=Araneus ventricosus TaxID=182803 RepID=A0A4Y2MZM5_ARAVE|nr:hypothetical protein AVEN_235934-1 [Araneus ventricosus]
MLAEIFLSFRRTSMQFYRLDPVHFITSAQLTWNSGLKISKVELQLLGNVNEYLWFENSMRGGVCLLGRRHAIANNPYVPENYDEKLPSNYILALDANNLYGFAMSQSLPIGNFRRLDSDQVSKCNVSELGANSDICYILEVDLIYPTHLHNMHNDLPLAPEHVLITYDMLSNYSKELCDEFGLRPFIETRSHNDSPMNGFLSDRDEYSSGIAPKCLIGHRSADHRYRMNFASRYDRKPSSAVSWR